MELRMNVLSAKIRHEENNMRSAFYVTVLVGLLTTLLAFSTASALTQTTSNPLTHKTSMATEHKGPTAKASESSHAKGGVATVARVERYGKCLHVFRDPSVYSEEIGCMLKGEKTHLTGVFSKNRRWAQLDNHGWVLFRYLKTDVKPPRRAAMKRSWRHPAAAGSGTPMAAGHRSYWGTSWGPM
jgi:hypothetical protein